MKQHPSVSLSASSINPVSHSVKGRLAKCVSCLLLMLIGAVPQSRAAVIQANLGDVTVSTPTTSGVISNYSLTLGSGRVIAFNLYKDPGQLNYATVGQQTGLAQFGARTNGGLVVMSKLEAGENLTTSTNVTTRPSSANIGTIYYESALGIWAPVGNTGFTRKYLGFQIRAAATDPWLYGWLEMSYALTTAGRQTLTFHQVAYDDSGAILAMGQSAPAAPANDNFVSRVNLTGTNITTTGSNVDATPETGEPTYVNRGRSVWWKWTAPANGTVTVTTVGSSFDTVLGVYTGNVVNNLTPIGQDDDSGGGVASRVSFAAVAGEVYQIAVDGYSGNSGSIILNLQGAESLPQTPVITSPSTATGTVGQPFSFQITASNGPTFYNATNLPANLTAGTNTGLISGIPANAGIFTVTLSASNAGGAGSQTLTITVNPSVVVVPTITSPNTTTATVGQSFTYQITANGAPTSFNATGLPAGLTVNSGTGLISGVPATNGTFSVGLSAVNGNGSGTQTLQLTVQSGTVDPSNGLQVWYKLDGNVLDYSGNGRHGLVTNMTPIYEAGAIGQGLKFSGSPQGRIDVPSWSPGTNSFTLAGWVRYNSTNEFSSFIPGVVKNITVLHGGQAGENERFGLSLFYNPATGLATPRSFIKYPSGAYYFCDGTNHVAVNQWVHLAVSFDRTLGQSRLYANGQLVSQTALPAAEPISLDWLHVSGFNNGFTHDAAHSGRLDDVRIYSREVTAQEVAQLATTLENGLEVWYKLDGDVVDYSGKGRHGIVTNMTASYETGAIGLGLKFPGTPQNRVDVPLWVPGTNSFSLSGWVRYNSTNEFSNFLPAVKNMTLFHAGVNGGQADRFGLTLNYDPTTGVATPRSFVRYPDGTYYFNNGTNPVPANQWMHFSAVFDRVQGQSRLYANGQLVAETAIPAEGNITPDWLHVSGFMNGTSLDEAHSGRLDDLRIYSRAITAQEVAQLATSLDSGLEAWYKFDGDLLDASGKNRHGVVTNMTVTYQPAAVGQGVKFPGTNAGRVDLPVFQPGSNSFSVSVWAKFDSFSEFNSTYSSINLFHSGAGDFFGGMGLYLQHNQSAPGNVYPTIWLEDSPPVGATGNELHVQSLAVNVPSNQWSLVTAVINREERIARLYLNGLEVAQTSISSLGPLNPTWSHIGGYNNGTHNMAHAGKLDDLRIYGRALSAAEIVQLAANPLETGLEGWYKLDGNVQDSSGKGRHGTVLNMVASYENGAVGQGLKFQGQTHNQVQLPVWAPASNSFSVAGWVRYNSTNEFSSYQYGRNMAVYFSAGGDFSDGLGLFLTFNTDLGTVTPASAMRASQGGGDFNMFATNHVSANQWHHLAVSVDRASATERLYLNGMLILEGSLAGLGSVNPTFAALGDYITHNMAHAGRLDDVRIYNRALSGTEVSQLVALGGTPVAAPVITSAASSQVSSHFPFSYQITASGVPTSYGVTGLPGLPVGLVLNPTTGLISGAITNLNAGVQTYTFTITASNAAGTGSITFTLEVYPEPPAITSPTTAAATVGQAFTYQITATNHPATYGASGLPAGLSVNTTNGLISGVPSVAGTFTVQMTATSAPGGGGVGGATLTLTIGQGGLPPAITSPTTASAVVGQPFSYQITALNNPTSFSATNLASGLTVNTGTGLVTGTPTTSGTFTVAILAANGAGAGSGTLTITVTAPIAIITPPQSQSVGAGGTVSFSVLATGSAPHAYQWQFNSSAISGANQATLVLTNVQTNQAGNYRVAVSNAAGAVNSAFATLTVTNPPAVTRSIRALAVGSAPGASVTVPVELVAQGDENAVSFTLNYDSSLFTFSSVALGTNAAGSTLTTNSTQLGQGRLGVLVSHASDSDTFGIGTKQILLVTLNVAANAPLTNSAITFGSTPVSQQVSSVDATSLPVTFQAGSVTLAGYEGDVGPRPNGDQVLDALDITQMLRYFSGRDSNDLNTAFLKADIAPRGTKGDGVLDALDITQLLRYIGGRDIIVPVGGPARVPAQFSSQTPSVTGRGGSRVAAALQASAVSPISIATVSGTAGGTVRVPITLGGQGIENSVSFSVSFDPAALTLNSVTLGTDAVGRTITTNNTQLASGRIGVLISHPSDSDTFGTGPKEIGAINFTIAAGASGTVALQLGSTPLRLQIADTDASPVALSTVDGGITLGPPPSPGVLQFASGTASVSESAGQAVLTVSRTGGAAGTVGVSYSTANGTALAGQDYVAITSTLAWNNADTADKQIVVSLLNDSVFESSESFAVGLSSPSGGANLGSTTTAAVTIIDDDPQPNPLPVVNITSPANSASFMAPASVSLTATATDDGSVAKVEFLLNNIKQGEDLSDPYTFIFANLAAGTHTLTARAIDNLGASNATSVSVVVTNVVISGLQLSAGQVAGVRNTQVVVPITAAGFSNLATMQFSLHWNAAVLQFVAVEQFGLLGLASGSFGFQQTNTGALALSWDDPNATGTNLAAGTTLFALRFNLIGTNGAASAITFDGTPTAIEFRNAQLQTVNGAFVSGQASVLNTLSVGTTASYFGSGTPVTNVTFSVTGDANLTAQADLTGSAAFTVTAGGNYTLTPTRLSENPAAQGVTTGDILSMRRHILNIEPLTGNALVAADADGLGTVTTGDILLVRRLILGITNTLPAGLWKFVPASATFTGLAANTNVTFVAVKVGDANGNWTPSGTVQPQARVAAATLPTVSFAASSETNSPGGTVTVSIRVNGFTNVTSAQFSIGWDTNVLSYLGVGGFNLTGLAGGNFGASQSSLGRLAVSWDDPNASGVSLAENTVIFTLSFGVTTNGGISAVSFGAVPTPLEVTVGGSPATFDGHNGTVTAPTSVLPTILAQPQGRVLVRGVDAPAVALIVVATNATSYQWLFNGSPISEATAAYLILPDAQRAHSGSYSVQVIGGGGSVLSSNAVLRIRAPQRFTQPPLRLGDGRFRLVFGDSDGGQITPDALPNLEVWASTNLTGGVWVRITNGISLTNGQVQVDDADSLGISRRFYRVFER